jgi:predicted nucleic acid-binding protein
MAVIDANVAVRWFVHGPGSIQAAAWMARTDLIAPELLMAEAGNAFWLYIRHKHLTIEEAQAVLQRLPRYFERLVPSHELVTDALALADANSHAVFDCLYIALARREATRVVTLDRALARIAEQTGVAADLLV